MDKTLKRDELNKDIYKTLIKETDGILQEIKIELQKRIPSFSMLGDAALEGITGSLDIMMRDAFKLLTRGKGDVEDLYEAASDFSENSLFHDISFTDLICAFYVAEGVIWFHVLRGAILEGLDESAIKKLTEIRMEITSKVVAKVSDVYLSTKDKQIYRQVSELSSLLEVGKNIVSTMDVEVILRLILEVSTSLMQVMMGSIMLLSEDGSEVEVASQIGLDRDWGIGKRFPLKYSLFELAHESGNYYFGVDEQLMGRNVPSTSSGSLIRSALVLPIEAKHKVIGAIELYDDRPKSFAYTDLVLISTFASQAGIAIENARLFEREKQIRKTAEYTRELTEDLSRSFNKNNALSIMVHKFVEISGVDRCTYYYYDPEDDTIEFAWGYGVSTNQRRILKNRRIKVSEIDEMTRTAVYTGEPLFIEEAESDPRISESSVKIFKLKSCLILPVRISRRDKPKGIITLDHTKKRKKFSRQEIEMLSDLAHQAAISLEHVELRDNTREKEMDLMKAESDRKVFEVRERAEAIVNSALDAIVMIDRDFRVMSFNPSASLITGWSEDEAIGMDCHRLFYGESMKGLACQNKDDCRIAGALRGDNPGYIEFKIPHKNGRLIDVGGTLSIIRNKKRQIESVILVFRDITTELEDRQTRIFRRELDIVREMLGNLLPKGPLLDDDFEVRAHQKFTTIVGGDWYDYWTYDDTLYLVIGDANGTGVPATLTATTAISLIRMAAKEEHSIESVIKTANRGLYSDEMEETYVTLFYAEIDLKNYLMKYVNGGHWQPVLLRRNRGGRYLPSPDPMLVGMYKDIGVRVVEYQLLPADRIVFYTDGVIEAKNKNREQFGEKRLMRLLNSGAFKPPDELVGDIMERLDDFSYELKDDVTIMTCDIEPNRRYFRT